MDKIWSDGAWEDYTDFTCFSPIIVEDWIIFIGGSLMSRRCILVGSVAEAELSSLGARRKEARVERRVVALRLIASGQLAKDIAPAVGVNEKTVREWVKAFNHKGVASLRCDSYKGSKPHLTAGQEAELAEDIRRGPPPEMGITVWRGWALRNWIRDRYGVEYSESGTYALLHRLGFSSLMPRPFHPERDHEAQEEFKKNSAHPPFGLGGRASRRKTRSVVSG